MMISFVPQNIIHKSCTLKKESFGFFFKVAGCRLKVEHVPTGTDRLGVFSESELIPRVNASNCSAGESRGARRVVVLLLSACYPL